MAHSQQTFSRCHARKHGKIGGGGGESGTRHPELQVNCQTGLARSPQKSLRFSGVFEMLMEDMDMEMASAHGYQQHMEIDMELAAHYTAIKANFLGSTWRWTRSSQQFTAAKANFLSSIAAWNDRAPRLQRGAFLSSTWRWRWQQLTATKGAFLSNNGFHTSLWR